MQKLTHNYSYVNNGEIHATGNITKSLFEKAEAIQRLAQRLLY
jgi:hypothetical protein